MPGAVFLRGEGINLRTVKPGDYGFLHEHGNDPIREGAPAPTPVSERDIEGFIESESSVQFLPRRDGSPVGFVFLFGIDYERDHAEIGYWVVPDEQGRGYATEAVALCLEHAFDDRGLHKVFARVFDHNDASMGVLESLGFQQEGRLREQDYVRGKYRDTYLFGILSREWQNKDDE